MRLKKFRRLGRRDDVSADELAQMQHQLDEMALREITNLVERMPSVDGAKVLRMLPPDRSLAVFDVLDPAHQAELVSALGDERVVAYFDSMGAEDRVALLDNLPAQIAERLLQDLDEDDQRVTNVVLGYGKGTVGRTMSPAVPDVTPDMTVREVVEMLRADVEELETIYTVPVIDEDRTLVGMVSLRRLFRARGDETIGEVMYEPESVHAMDEDEGAARWLMSTDLLAVPVVDEDERLVGIFTYDEAQDVVEQADTEDSARVGASEPLGKPYLSTPVTQLVRSRVVWLLVLAISATLTVKVLDVFEETLEQAVVLAAFIPLLTGTGGNTGNQAATTVTRALALDDVRKRDVFHVMWRELRVGMMLGAVLGLLGVVIAGLVYDTNIGLTIGATLFMICSVSATVGGMMPIVAKAIGADPAVFSNPFISTFCDATGLIIYFLIARAILQI
ncbi:magnesium transporter [Corynebacterium timonense]|uniref:Magnesium transporter MgtE n=1 Tax=Corynebacterium timonense TaxID=441500 RepID=A0A1H1TSA8_9CORY|nr:magnesium transporter [Corynebacterium timonense]SDS63097.1 magnesium transporter [Corynebacterium timonense]